MNSLFNFNKLYHTLMKSDTACGLRDLPRQPSESHDESLRNICSSRYRSQSWNHVNRHVQIWECNYQPRYHHPSSLLLHFGFVLKWGYGCVLMTWNSSRNQSHLCMRRTDFNLLWGHGLTFLSFTKTAACDDRSWSVFRSSKSTDINSSRYV